MRIISNTGKVKEKHWTTLYQLINIYFRTRTILEVLNEGISLILIDSDHYWITSPLPWLRNQTGYDIIVENNSVPPAWSVCAGFLFLNSTKQTRAFWSKVDQHTKFFRSYTETNHISEQTVISRTLFEMWKQQQQQESVENNNNFAAHIRQKRSWRTRFRRISELWDIADGRFPAPEQIKWDFFPKEKVVSGNLEPIWKWICMNLLFLRRVVH